VDNVAIDRLTASAYTVPLDAPESDGTLTWDATTAIVVEVWAEGVSGIGVSYATPACVRLIGDVLRRVVLGAEPLDVPGTWLSMVRAIRNFGRPGVASMAIAAIDTALWDLKARLCAVPLFRLLGAVTDAAPVYGSGGFTSYSESELCARLGAFVHEQAIPRVKMKIGTGRGSAPDIDLERIAKVRAAVGDSAELFVDANGAYDAKQAIAMGPALSDLDVRWFEEPVSSDHLAQLRQVRAALPFDVTAGEYGYDLFYFERMCGAEAVDVLQADVTRCAGITEWLRAASVAAAHGLEISGHCAQSLHAHPACSVPNLRHLEYFHDHAVVDRKLFEGVLDPEGGVLRPDPDAPGTGLALRADAERFLVARDEQ
jgi:L-alanine-DL-glutamate epimerase-like enolase superfamily enzyme